MSRQIKLSENMIGVTLYAEVDSHRLWLEVEGPEQRCIHSCVYRRADLEALAELVAEALAALPDEEELAD